MPQGKTLAELQTEIELGLNVYPDSNHDVFVFFDNGWYVFARTYTPVECESVPGTDASHGERVLIGGNYSESGAFLGGGVIFDDCYHTFEALLADWPSITSQPVWGTIKTPERIAYKQAEDEKYLRRRAEQEKKWHDDMMRRRASDKDLF